MASNDFSTPSGQSLSSETEQSHSLGSPFEPGRLKEHPLPQQPYLLGVLLPLPLALFHLAALLLLPLLLLPLTHCTKRQLIPSASAGDGNGEGGRTHVSSPARRRPAAG